MLEEGFSAEELDFDDLVSADVYNVIKDIYINTRGEKAPCLKKLVANYPDADYKEARSLMRNEAWEAIRMQMDRIYNRRKTQVYQEYAAKQGVKEAAVVVSAMERFELQANIMLPKLINSLSAELENNLDTDGRSVPVDAQIRLLNAINRAIAASGTIAQRERMAQHRIGMDGHKMALASKEDQDSAEKNTLMELGKTLASLGFSPSMLKTLGQFAETPEGEDKDRARSALALVPGADDFEYKDVEFVEDEDDDDD